MKILRYIAPLFLLSLSFMACTGETATTEQKPVDNPDENTLDLNTAIQGNWNVTAAIRNKKPTESLNDLFFQFHKEELTSNFNMDGTEKTTSFKIEDKKVTQDGVAPMVIEKLDNDAMVLLVELAGQKMKLRLERTPEE